MTKTTRLVLAVLVCICCVSPAGAGTAARAPAGKRSSARLLQSESLPHLMPGPNDLPADALLTNARPPGEAVWGNPPWRPGRSPWSIRVGIVVAKSPEEAVGRALNGVLVVTAVRTTVIVPEVKPVGPYAGLGERVWAKAWSGGAQLVFVRGNAVVSVSTSGGGPERAFALARAIVRKIEAARAGRPEPATPLSMEGPPARVGGVLRRSQAASPWGGTSDWLVFQVGDEFRRALPARRMPDGDHLVPLLLLNRALNLPLDARMDGGDPKQWRLRLGDKKLWVTLGDQRVFDGQRAVTLAHPVQTVSGAMVVPLSLLHAVYGWSITPGSWQGVDAVRLSPPPGRTTARRPAAPAKPKALPPPTAQEAKSTNPRLAVARRVYGFDRWPGKHGPARPGVSARRVLLEMDPPLREVRIHPPERDRQGTLTGPPSVSWRGRAAGVGVTVYATCEEAQQGALRALTERGRTETATPGASYGLSLGDVSFLYGEPDRTRSVLFVRSNVTVYVYAAPGEAIDIAEAMDGALLARPTANSLEELERLRPRIVELGLEGDPAQPVDIPRAQQEREGRAWTHPLRLTASDPEGGSIGYAWTALTPDIGVVKDKRPGYSIYLFAASPYGPHEYTVLLTAANECGLFSQRRLTVRANVVKEEERGAGGER